MDSNNTDNETFSISAVANLTVQYMYIGFAAFVLLSNAVIGTTFMRNIHLFKKSAFNIGLAVGDIILGLGTITAGIIRMSLLWTNTKDVPVHPSYCLETYTTLLMIGTQLPATMIFLISTERILAVVCFDWYYKKWSSRKAWLVVTLGFAYCTVSIATSWFVVYNFPANITTPLLCTTSVVVGPVYATYHFYIAVFAGVWAIIATVFSLLTFINKRKKFQANANDNLKRFIQKQWQMTLSTTCIALFDFMLVVIPNILLSMTAYMPSLLLLGNYATCMLCLRSASNLFIYVLFNRDFRSALLTTFNFNKANSSIQPFVARRPVIVKST